MDYKYIEQLLERYWQCETTVEEEAILRAFFSQQDVPTALLKYRPLFVCQQQTIKEQKLGDDFDAKILSMIEEPAVKAKTITMWSRLTPLFKAAAVVAIVITLGNAAQFSMNDNKADEDINYASYKDTYKDPSVAYSKVEDALELMSEGISKAQNADSADAAKATSIPCDSMSH